jgi:hypothetical protein
MLPGGSSLEFPRRWCVDGLYLSCIMYAVGTEEVPTAGAGGMEEGRMLLR